MKILIFTLLISLFNSVVSAGEIAKGKVMEVVNLIGEDVLFAVHLKPGSSGPCANTWIRIRESSFNGNIESYKFAFSLVSTALVTDKTIRIHNYSDDICDGATFLGLYND